MTIEVRRVGDGRARARMRVTKERTNLHGIAHMRGNSTTVTRPSPE